jgi:hypothetical protein
VGKWDDTQLFKQLAERPNAKRQIEIAQAYLPDIERVLRSGAPASVDFTLHDDEHSFRVAEQSAVLIGKGLTQISDIELMLLLFACYGHDVGMSPGRDRVRDHYSYLISGDPGPLDSTELAEFQAWLDANREGLTPPIGARALTREGLNYADEIIAYYSRFKHNDWSETFLRQALGAGTEQLYVGWIDDLVTLCRSHHEGLTQLRQARFDAKIVGSPASPLNLRYLAAVLRLADVLEFDPERTPGVILKQRGISPSSRVFWYKDHSISFVVNSDESTMIFTAQTPSALIHRAVLDTADWVDSELQTCAALNQEGAFSRGLIPLKARENYQWPWPSRLARAIAEIPGRFEYIEGGFKPDTQKVLKLLSGTALYGNPIVAVRELLQNALDAVREQIAYMRLSLPNGGDDKTLSALQGLHRISLTFSKDDTGVWLHCADNGSGMTKSIIQHSLLISGSSVRGEVRRLARDAERSGFKLERTGRFGIGVLSYFMVADQFTLVTRRSQEAGDVDAVSWRFTSEGLFSFGELSRESRGTRGTSVSLRILPEIFEADEAGWISQVRDYVIQTIRHLPCALEVRSEIEPIFSVMLKPGWTSNHADSQKSYLEKIFTDRKPRLVSTLQEQQRAIRYQEKLTRQRQAAAAAMQVGDILEVDLDVAEGRMRASLTYFALPGGKSAAFFEVYDDNSTVIQIRPPTTIIEFDLNESMHGILVGQGEHLPPGCLVEIDYGEVNDITVDRHNFIRKHRSIASTEILSLCETVWIEFLEENILSVYRCVNVALSPLGLGESKNYLGGPAWLIVEGRNRVGYWLEIDEPVISLERVSYMQDYSKRYVTHDGLSKEAVQIFGNRSRDKVSLTGLYAGGSLVHYNMDDEFGGFVGLRWSGKDSYRPVDETVGSLASKFPPEWRSVLWIITNQRAMINEDHALSRLLENVERRPKSVGSFSFEQTGISLNAASQSQLGSLGFVASLLEADPKTWVMLREQHQEHLQALFARLGIADHGKLMMIDARELGTSSYTLVDLYSVAFDTDYNLQKRAAPQTSDDHRIVEMPSI